MVATRLHLSKEDVERLVRRGEIPFDRQGDRVVFRQMELDAWASQRLLGGTPESVQKFHRKSSLKAHDLSLQRAIIPELLKPSFIQPALASRTKAAVIRDMVQLADLTGLLYSVGDLFKSIEARERLCSTALPGGMALLHPRSPDPFISEDSFIVMGRTVQSLPFGAPDGGTTDLFFLLCSQDEQIHLHVLARLCTMCQRTRMIPALREAAEAAALYAILVQAEEEIIRQL